MTYDDGLVLADEFGFEVMEHKGPLKSFSVLVDGTCAIAMNFEKIDSMEEKTVALFHELGHGETGSFYNFYSPIDIREKHEYRADKWAAHRIIPPDTFIKAIEDGYTEIWQLAEHFGVTEDFIRRTDFIYKCEGIIDRIG